MKRLFKILMVFLLSFTLVGCNFLDLTIDEKPPVEEKKEAPTIKEIKYIGITDNKKEYLMIFNDGSTQIIHITDEVAPVVNEITILDLYEAAVEDGYSGTMSDFIAEYISDTAVDSKEGIIKGLKSSVSVFAKFTKTTRTVPIIGLPQAETEDYLSAGSGVIYKLDKESGTAYIVTNHHVVYDAESDSKNGVSGDIEIYLYGLELEDFKIAATYVGGSEKNDVAVLKITDSDIIRNSIAEVVTVADSDIVEVGDNVVAIGNAQGGGISVTKGIISVTSEYIMLNTSNHGIVDFRVMRVDAAVNKGNSGGGLFNSRGEVIGIINAKTISEEVDSIGYALPANTVFNLADNIIYYCDNRLQEKGEKVLMGVTMKIVDRVVSYDEVNDKITVKDVLKASEIAEGSLASQHFELDDEFVSITIHGKTYEITRLYQVGDLLFKVRRNDTITIRVIRDGNLVDLEISFTNENFNVIQ
ncbi:MAG: trypsin-like peptidase domain-containing protein [Acholeplasmataceae bacterium]